MFIPGVNVNTVHPPALYTPLQIEQAVYVAARLARGPFVLCTPGAVVPDAPPEDLA